jgi:histidinol-phosphate aminotransferase
MNFARLHLSESPFAPVASLRAVAAEIEAIHQYPDPDCSLLAGAIAQRWSVEPHNVAVSNGIDELLLLCALTLGDLSRPGVTSAGTFSGYRYALEVARRGCLEVALLEGRVDVGALISAMDGTGVTFICTPHNPSGAALTRDELCEVVSAARTAGTVLVVDEAYMEFAPRGTASVASMAASAQGLVALRTFSKAYGLAGLRVGYALCDHTAAQALRFAQRVLPFRVNRLAQVAALAAITDLESIEHVRDRTAEIRSWFIEELRAQGFDVPDSVTNFIIVRLADPTVATRILLEEHAIAVRDTSNMGYPGYVRISLGTQDELERTIRALVEVRRRLT